MCGKKYLLFHSMKKLKDIRENLDPDIRLQEQYPKTPLSVSQESEDAYKHQDIRTDLSDIDIHTPEKIQIEKNKTRFFDSLSPKSFFFPETIDLGKKNDWRKALLDFRFPQKWNINVFLILVVIVGFLWFLDKNFVENRVNAWYEKLFDAFTGTWDIQQAKHDVNDARFDFLVSDVFFTPFKIFWSEKVQNAYHIIKWGKKLTLSLDSIFEMYQETLNFVATKNIEEIYFTQMFQNLQWELLKTEDELRSTLDHYSQVTTTWDQNIDVAMKQQIDNLKFFLSKLTLLNNNFSTFLDIFGHSERRTYLIVFQNSDEIRPTGGFMGSMATVSLFRWQVKDFTPRDVYAFEWDLKRSDYQRVNPPKWINELTNSFGLRDANYYINLKDSSEAIKFFVEQSGQPIDGVIYINQSIIEDLLDITWPIYFDPLEREITGDNFSEIMSLIVEAKIFKQGTQGTPKKILFDFIDTFKQKLISQKQYGQYLKVLQEHFQSREIMMYSFHPEENKLLMGLWFWGDIDFSKTLDFAYPVFTSLSWNKSDRYMQRSYKKRIEIQNNCNIQTSLDIISRHGFSTRKRLQMEKLMQEYGIDKNVFLDIQWQGDNYQFVRVLLPENAVVTPQESMVIRDYGKRQGVEFFIRTRPTETTTYTLQYSLSNLECQRYTYGHFKQPGIESYDIEVLWENTQESFSWLRWDFFYSEEVN